MRRSTRRSSMAVSLDSALDADAFKRVTSISTRRSSSIVPPPDEPRNLVGNFTTKFSMSSFVKRVEDLTQDQRAAIERVGFGNLLHIHQHTLRKNLLVEWMERWDCEKRAFLLLDRELTIAPVDVALILGLRVTGHTINLNEVESICDLEEAYGASSSSRKISVSALERRLDSLGDVASEDFIRTFLLFVFGTLLFPNSNSKIDSRYLSFLRDLDEVPDYAWGVAVLEDLFSCLSKRKEEQAKSMEGCLLLLQIWSYEHIDIARPNLLDCSSGFPRACHWDSSRCTSARHWFAAKFNELEESQVMWKLQPTETESDIDVIKELLETKTRKKEVYTHNATNSLQNSTSVTSAVDVGIATTTTRSTTTRPTQGMGLPPKSSRRSTIMVEEPKEDRGRVKHDLRDDISENSQLSSSVSEITVEFPEYSSSSSMREVQTAGTSHHIKEDYRDLKTEYTKLKEDMAELRRENANLRNQLAMNPNFEEEIAKLRKEVAELKEENLSLRSPVSVVDQVERLIFQYYDTTQDAPPHENNLTVL